MCFRSLIVCALVAGNHIPAFGQALVPPRPPGTAPVAARATPPDDAASAVRSLPANASRQDTLNALRAAFEIARSAQPRTAATDEPALVALSMLNALATERSVAASTELLRMRVGSSGLFSVLGATARTESDTGSLPVTAAAFRDGANALGRILAGGGPLAMRAMATHSITGTGGAYTMFTGTAVAATRAGSSGGSGRGGSVGGEVAIFRFIPGSLAQLLRADAEIPPSPENYTGLRISGRVGVHSGVGGRLAEGARHSVLFGHGLLELLVNGRAAFGLNYVHVGPKEWRNYSWEGLYLSFSGMSK